MPASKKASKKKATKKKGSKKHRGGHGGGGGGIPIDIDSQDPVIVTGGGSARLDFNPSQFRGLGGRHRNASASPVSVIIDGTVYSVTPTSTIVIRFS
ncbi:MAG: hypothetical protein DMF68_04540 [Acidobacteria bacterium]|nr:MAG: hypothetical protein DMF68_04540 [Acidobacteriota bacterium]